MTFNLYGTDWATWFYPLGVHLRTLYEGVQHYPPFVYLLVHPLTWFGMRGGYVGLVLLSLLIVYLNVRSIPKLILAAFSLPTLISITHGNVDTLLTLAFLLPPSLGALVIACKPQALVGWWVRGWIRRGGRVKETLPLAGLVVGSFLIWGAWVSHLVPTALATNFLASQGWPWTMGLGIPFLLSNSPLLWLIGGVLCSPYLQFYHLTPLVVYAVSRKGIGWGIGVCVVSWVVGVMAYG